MREGSRKGNPHMWYGKVLNPWHLLNKIVATIFIVISFFFKISSFLGTWDGRGTGLGQMESGSVGRAS